jgi:hypothetical protein
MNYFEGAALIVKVRRSLEEDAEIGAFIGGIAGEPERERAFFEYCKLWKLAPWVYTQLERLDLLGSFSAETKQMFHDLHAKVKTENENRNREAVRFLTEFKKHGIDVIVLKGNLLAHSVYKDTGYKKMNDFDILIHSEDWDKIQDIYLGLGYIPLGFGWSGEKEKPAKFSHVGMSYISSDYSCIIGSQWGLKSATTGYTVNIDEAWQTAKAFDFCGVDVKQLSPENNLLHLVLHMGIYKCGIRDCMDVFNLMLSESIDEERFYAVIKQSGAEDKAYFTLTLSNLCAQTPDRLTSGLLPRKHTFISRRLKKRVAVYAAYRDFHLSYNDYFQDVEKIVIYFNLFPQFHKKLFLYLSVVRHIFFPKTELALKLSDSSQSRGFFKRLKARLKAPYFVFSLIAQEIGWLFTFLLFMKLFFDLIFSLKNYIFKKESYFDYLKKKGIDPKEIERVVKNIQ